MCQNIEDNSIYYKKKIQGESYFQCFFANPVGVNKTYNARTVFVNMRKIKNEQITFDFFTIQSNIYEFPTDILIDLIHQICRALSWT